MCRERLERADAHFASLQAALPEPMYSAVSAANDLFRGPNSQRSSNGRRGESNNNGGGAHDSGDDGPFERLAWTFGFQADSVHCQKEALVLAIANEVITPPC